MVNDYLMNMMFKGGDMGARIKSVQRGVVEMDGVAWNTGVINEVDLEKSVCLYLGCRGTYTQPQSLFAGVRLNSSTEIFGRRIGSQGITYVSYMVVEFETGINSSQRDTVVIAANETSDDHTINEVDLSKSLLAFGGCFGTAPTYEKYILSTLEFVNSTTLRATRGEADIYTNNIYFDLLEFE